MSFLEYRSYQFQPDKSRGQESDYIVMPNILVLVRNPWSVSSPAPCTGRSLEGSIYGSWVDSAGFLGAPWSLAGGIGQSHGLSLFNLQI